jgi:VPS28 protein
MSRRDGHMRHAELQGDPRSEPQCGLVNSHCTSWTTTWTLRTMSASLSLDEEARLYTTNAEREKYESLATLYGIVVTLDYLERAYVRDSVTAAECVLILIVVGNTLRARG